MAESVAKDIRNLGLITFFSMTAINIGGELALAPELTRRDLLGCVRRGLMAGGYVAATGVAAGTVTGLLNGEITLG